MDQAHPPGPPGPSAAAPGFAPARAFGRFELLRWLGQGGMGTVYLARDRERDRTVALKLLIGAEPDALTRFKREFRALADISHPNLIVLHELLCEQGHWLFTMDYVEGRDFLQHVCALEAREAPTLLELDAELERRTRGGPEPGLVRCPMRAEAQLRRVLAQLVDAVRLLHAAGKLHLDLKPSNVLVSASDHVTVLDFGLARDLKQSARGSTQRLLGTPAYMAPEQARDGRFEPASDWYAVGVMLYEALCGRLPFDGPVAQILLSKTSRDPEPPSALCREVPAALEALCMALLARDPERRPSGAEIMAQLGQGLSRAPELPAPITSELFVGRGRMLAQLHAQSSARERPRILLLHGSSGVGKTSLAKRFLEELAARPHTLVLRGACYEREAMPFKGFDGIVDALIAALSRLTPLEQGALLPRRADALTRLFPAFLALKTPAPPRAGRAEEDPELGRARAFRAFAELFGRLSERSELVLFIDDLHWSDLDSAQLLRALLEGPDPIPLLLIGTYRRDERGVSPLLAQIAELAKSSPKLALEEAEIGALEPAEAEALAAQLLAHARCEERASAQQIARESQGVPLFIHELVRHAARAQPSIGRELSLHEALTERIASLPEHAARLLEVLALAAGPAPQRVAFRAAGLSAGQEAALHLLRVAGLAKSRGARSDDLVETAHDRVRGAAVDRLAPEARARIHAQLFSAFEAEAERDHERLFMHALGAGLSAQALVYAERAAGRASAALAYHRSAELYRAALALLAREAAEDRERRAQALEGLAHALAASDHSLDSAETYLRAADYAPSAALASLERRAAAQLLRGGDVSRGSELLRRVLERVGVSYPSTPSAALAALTFERARLFARGLAFEERPPESIPARERDRLEALRVALGVYWLVEPVRGALFATLYLRYALDAGEPHHVLRGLETETGYVALVGGARAEARAGELYAAARALTERIGRASTRSGSKLAEASLHAIYGRKQQSRDCALEALRAPGPQGLSWERAYARFHIYQSALYIGARPGLAEEVAEAVRDAETRRDRFAAAILLPMLGLTRLMSDEPERAREALARMRPLLSPDVFTFLDAQEMIWTALAHQYAGDVEAALSHYAARAERYRLSGVARLSTWRLLHQWGLLLAHLGALERGGRARRHARAAERCIRQIERERIAWPLAFAAMGRAALHHRAGQFGERDRALGRAIQQSEALGYGPFRALFARSAALFAGDRQAVAAHERALREFGVKSPEGWRRTWAPCLGGAPVASSAPTP